MTYSYYFMILGKNEDIEIIKKELIDLTLKVTELFEKMKEIEKLKESVEILNLLCAEYLEKEEKKIVSEGGEVKVELKEIEDIKKEIEKIKSEVFERINLLENGLKEGKIAIDEEKIRNIEQKIEKLSYITSEIEKQITKFKEDRNILNVEGIKSQIADLNSKIKEVESVVEEKLKNVENYIEQKVGSIPDFHSILNELENFKFQIEGLNNKMKEIEERERFIESEIQNIKSLNEEKIRKIEEELKEKKFDEKITLIINEIKSLQNEIKEIKGKETIEIEESKEIEEISKIIENLKKKLEKGETIVIE